MKTKFDRRTIKALLAAYDKISAKVKEEDPTFYLMLNDAIQKAYRPFSDGRNVSREYLDIKYHNIIYPLIFRLKEKTDPSRFDFKDDLLSILVNMGPNWFTLDSIHEKMDKGVDLTAVENGLLIAIGYINAKSHDNTKRLHTN